MEEAPATPDPSIARCERMLPTDVLCDALLPCPHHGMRFAPRSESPPLPPHPIGPTGIPLPEGFTEDFEPLDPIRLDAPPPDYKQFLGMAFDAWTDVRAWAQQWLRRARAAAGDAVQRFVTATIATGDVFGETTFRDDPPLHIGHPVIEGWCAVFQDTLVAAIRAIEHEAMAYIPAMAPCPPSFDPAEYARLQELLTGPGLYGSEYRTDEPPYRTMREMQQQAHIEACQAKAQALLPGVEHAITVLGDLCLRHQRAKPSPLVQAVLDLQDQVRSAPLADQEERNTFGQGSF